MGGVLDVYAGQVGCGSGNVMARSKSSECMKNYFPKCVFQQTAEEERLELNH